LSRTARMADVTIVDNIVRAIPNMVEIAEDLKDAGRDELTEIVNGYDNKAILRRAIEAIRDNLTKKADEVFRG